MGLLFVVGYGDKFILVMVILVMFIEMTEETFFGIDNSLGNLKYRKTIVFLSTTNLS